MQTIVVEKKTESGFIITVIEDDSSVNFRKIHGTKSGESGNPSCYTSNSRQRRFYAEIKKDGEYHGSVFASYPTSRRTLNKVIYFLTAEAAIKKIEKVLDSGDYSTHFGRYYAI
jgi:hypothetical protein